MQVTGEIKRVLPTKEVGADKFKVREFHVVTDEQYAQTLNIQFTQDKCSLLDNYPAGTKVKVEINIKGKEATKTDGSIAVFNTLQAWKIEKQ